MQPAQADFVGDCSKILNGTQQSFKDLFPTDPPNQFFDTWCYRAYPGRRMGEATLLAGMTTGNSQFPAGVYVMGPPFGSSPAFVGSVNEVLTLLGLSIDLGEGSNQDTICDNSSNNQDIGIVQTQEGNKITVTTNGQCIKPPENNSFCDIAGVPDDNGGFVETGIHALTTTTIDNVLFTGFKIPTIPTIPGIPGIPEFSNPLDSIVNSLRTKTCMIHALEGISDLEIETDICMDLTDQIGALPGVTPPVTLKFIGLSNIEIVNDCMQTDAETVTNLATGKVFQKINGVFVEIN